MGVENRYVCSNLGGDVGVAKVQREYSVNAAEAGK
jgi:hypothetical protein